MFFAKTFWTEEKRVIRHRKEKKMFGKKNDLKNEKRITDIDKVLYNVIGNEWNNIPSTSDHWVKYKAALRPRPGETEAFDVRIFDEWAAKEKSARIVDYSSLDDHLDLIVLEGWYSRKTKKGDVKLRSVKRAT